MIRVVAKLKSGKIVSGSDAGNSFASAVSALTSHVATKEPSDPIVRVTATTQDAADPFKISEPRKKATPAAEAAPAAAPAPAAPAASGKKR